MNDDQPSPPDHTGRVAIVTGGTKGIGRHIAAAYAAAGATVVVCGRTPPEAADQSSGAVSEGTDSGSASTVSDDADRGSGGSNPTFIACDVREPDQVQALVDQTVERFGRLDVVVNNAGGAPWADSATASPRFNERIIALNLLAPLTVSQAAYRAMREQDGGGAIVNICSVSGTRPSPGTVAYGAAKAGLLNVTQTLAVEWAPEVRVNAVVAGLIATEQAHLFYGDEQTQAKVAGTVPMGRLGTPDDVAAACLFLSSPAASYVTGAALAVHGGNERPAYLSVSSPGD